MSYASFSNSFDISASFNFGFNPLMFRGINPQALELLEAAGDLADAIGNYQDALANFYGSRSSNYQCCNPAPVEEPNPSDSTQPSGSLEVKGDVIMTAGGYQIEMVGQYEWKITGPDGKTTRIWGDPHVDEGDGGKWDFKRNSTFVLGDGTRINVTTAPFNNMTVTSGLEIISGNDRVLVSGIEQGKGEIGTVTQDGYQHVNSFAGNDVFVMGRETDDWSYTGREITGSENGGESFTLGGDLYAGGSTQTSGVNDGFDLVNSLLNSFLSNWFDSFSPNDFGFNPYYGNNSSFDDNSSSTNYDRQRHLRNMADAFHALADAYNAAARFLSLSDQISNNRSRFMLA